MSSPADNPSDAVYRAARERCNTPALFLLITGLLNLIIGGMLVVAELRVVGLDAKGRQYLVLDFWAELAESQKQRLRDLPIAAESDDLLAEFGHVLELAGRDAELGGDIARGVDELGLPLLVNGVMGVAIAVLAMFVSVQMFRLRGRRACLVASIAAILLILTPTVVFVIGYVFKLWDTSTQFAYFLPTCCGGLGAFIYAPSIIWCLSVLRSPEVRLGFERKRGNGSLK